MKKIIKNSPIFIGILLLTYSSLMMILRDGSNPTTWHILIGIGLLFIFFSRIEKFNFFGILSATLQQAKIEISEEGEKIKIQLAFQSMISDCLGNDRENVRNFFSNGKTGDEILMPQFSDLYLNILEKEKILSYRKDIGKVVNGIGEARDRYIVTLKKQMKI